MKKKTAVFKQANLLDELSHVIHIGTVNIGFNKIIIINTTQNKIIGLLSIDLGKSTTEWVTHDCIACI